MTRQTHKPQTSENSKKINIPDFPPVKILFLNNACHLSAQ